MADITLWGASYSDVPSILLPKTGGGTAQFFEVDGSDTVTENGTYDVSALAQLIVNVAGGGGGLEYEEGIYTPSSDTAHPTISFTNSHSTPPCFAMIADVDSYSSNTQCLYLGVFFDYYRLFGDGIAYTSSAKRYASWFYTYRGNSTSSMSSAATHCTYNSDNTSSSSTSYSRYYASPTQFKPYTGSSSRYFRSGRSYHWLAVWK